MTIVYSMGALLYKKCSNYPICTLSLSRAAVCTRTYICLCLRAGPGAMVEGDVYSYIHELPGPKAA